MNIKQELKNVIEADRENIDMEADVKRLEKKIRNNHKLIIKHFFPYLLSAYKNWRPRLEEKAMAMDFESRECFEVTIKKIDGYMVRAQGKQDDVYYRFELNPTLEDRVHPDFIIPKSSYDEINDFFAFKVSEYK